MNRAAGIPQAWIYKPLPDLVFVLLPSFLITAAVLAFPQFFAEQETMPPWTWLLLIVGVDVAHVYSTLWRTYLDPEEMESHRRLLTWTPILVYSLGVLLHAIDGMLFWRVMAYLAVFHFVRQQYGFMAVYSRKDNRPNWKRQIDAITVYLLTLVPILHWHLHLPKSFNWFIEGDFIAIQLPWLENLAWICYFTGIFAYLFSEMWLAKANLRFNLPKNLIILGTGLSWYVGIVHSEGDLAFTATNVLAHGIPYMAMVWFYGKKKQQTRSSSPNIWMKVGFNAAFLPLFIGLLLALGYLEEGLWDGMVWHDHTSLFPWAQDLPFLAETKAASLLVPLLSVPQVTHYVLDGYIWKMRKPGADLQILS
jgi:hypothetical protein